MKERKSKVTIFAILTTVTILAGVFFDAYRRLTIHSLSSIPENILTPLDSTLDIQTLDLIEKRRNFATEELASESAKPSPPIKESSKSASLP